MSDIKFQPIYTSEKVYKLTMENLNMLMKKNNKSISEDMEGCDNKIEKEIDFQMVEPYNTFEIPFDTNSEWGDIMNENSTNIEDDEDQNEEEDVEDEEEIYT